MDSSSNSSTNGGPARDEVRIGESRVAPARPKFLGEYLDAQNTHFSVFNDRYFGFLQAAVEAVEQEKNSPISVDVRLKIGKEEEKTSDLGVHHLTGHKDDDSNNNFAKLFYFYSSFGEVVSGSSFEKIGEEKRTWSHSELEVFLRDLRVIPKLLSKEEMRDVWEDASNYRIQRYEKPLSQLDLEEGKEMMTRIALFIYMRPGMKKMILATQGSFPLPAEMVNCLIHYMRIDDVDFVSNHIRFGKGRQTQGKLNYVSKSEEKVINKEHLSDDLLYKGYKHEAIKTKLKDKRGHNSHTLFSPLRRPQLKPKFTQLDDHIPDSIRVMLAAPQPKVEKSSRPNTSEGAAATRSTTSDPAVTEQDALGAYALPLNAEPVSPKAPVEQYYEFWNPVLQKVWDKYCQEPLSAHNDPNLESSRAPFIDGGHVEMGTPLTVFINVKNRSAHELDVDVYLRNFEDDNEPKVITRAGLLAPGITRQLQVNLRSDYSVKSVVGIIEVSLRNILQNFDELLDVPIFFYTGPYVLLGGDRVPMPVTAETVQARYSSLLDDKLAAGLVMDDSLSMRDEGNGAEEVYSIQSTVSSIKGGSVSLAGFDATGAVDTTAAAADDKSSLASKLSANFSRSRSSWYKAKTVGGGGRTLKAYTTEKYPVGSGASVASGLRSAAASMRSSAGLSNATTRKMETSSSRRKEADIRSLFDDGSVMTFS